MKKILGEDAPTKERDVRDLKHLQDNQIYNVYIQFSKMKDGETFQFNERWTYVQTDKHLVIWAGINNEFLIKICSQEPHSRGWG